MKFVHLSDLHLGKRVNEFSMLEDQQYILLRVLQIIEGEKPDAVVIAGDVYDKAIPPAEAVTVFDEFLVKLAAMKLQVFVISGNHDSAERIAFGGRLMDASGIHMAPVYHGEVSPMYELTKSIEKVMAALWMTMGMPRESRGRITFLLIRKCRGWKSK